MDISRGGSSSSLFPGRTGLWNVSFRDGGGGGKPEDPGKNPRSKDEKQQQTQIM